MYLSIFYFTLNRNSSDIKKEDCVKLTWDGNINQFNFIKEIPFQSILKLNYKYVMKNVYSNLRFYKHVSLTFSQNIK